MSAPRYARVAALYDIHGNAPALEAVLDDVAREEVDAVVIGGDVVPGPMPARCLALLRALAVPVHPLRGNGEREVLTVRGGGAPSASVPEAALAAIRWNASQLGDEEADWLAGWPAGLVLDIGTLGPVRFCHATPGSDTALVTRRTPEAEVAALLAPLAERTLVCGHTHMQYERRVGDRTREGGRTIVNAGSVGMPFGEPGAYWLLLGEGLTLRYTAYDLARAADRVRGTALPGAEGHAATLLRPPTEAAMLARFTPAPG